MVDSVLMTRTYPAEVLAGPPIAAGQTLGTELTTSANDAGVTPKARIQAGPEITSQIGDCTLRS